MANQGSIDRPIKTLEFKHLWIQFIHLSETRVQVKYQRLEFHLDNKQKQEATITMYKNNSSIIFFSSSSTDTISCLHNVDRQPSNRDSRSRRYHRSGTIASQHREGWKSHQLSRIHEEHIHRSWEIDTKRNWKCTKLTNGHGWNSQNEINAQLMNSILAS